MIAGIVKAGMEEYVENFLTKLMQHSRKDEGCIAYNIHRSKQNPLEFMLYSTWTNQEAFEHHNQSPTLQEFKKKLAQEMFEEQSPKTYWETLD